MPILTALYRYPVKSIHSETLMHSAIDPSGLPDDRAWLIADHSGRFMTGRDWPQMVRIRADVDAGALTLNAPGMPTLRVARDTFDQAHPAQVWKDEFGAWHGPVAADRWLSDFLGTEARLLYTGQESQRRVKHRPDLPLSFADRYPLLLIGESSRRQLSDWAGQDFAMARFRPNLVVDDAVPFAEDGWQRIRIGDVVLRMVKPCERCVFTTVDPDTGEKSSDQEPLRTLARRRKGEGGVLFGQHALAESAGHIEVGMPVEILD
ncbi:MOSC domain-containing protein [Jeongeupia naejangsanensis]|uniref:MOSC domain-containing protein n=1 Tax=Jeongeupia naejangsanensis TaxID=613195 RepID=A0ABS2BPC3_9NEIS|nr:MOSC domain-containing protein [Jeongeupia naejangsanensis]MBM3116903.1 MOSC domain-containing protein [Jeongeupia naejangsanensis]